MTGRFTFWAWVWHTECGLLGAGCAITITTGVHMAIPEKYRNRHIRIRIENDRRFYRSGRVKPEATIIVEHAKDKDAPWLITKFEPVMEAGLEHVEAEATIPDDDVFVDEDTGETRPIYPQWNTESYDIMEWGDGELVRDIARRFGFYEFLGECIGVGCRRRHKSGGVVDAWEDPEDEDESDEEGAEEDSEGHKSNGVPR